MVCPPASPTPSRAGLPGQPGPGALDAGSALAAGLDLDADLALDAGLGLDADLALELDAVVTGLEEPSEAELAGCWPDPSADRPDGCADWCADQAADADGGRACAPGPGSGFAEGGVLDELCPGPALAGFSQRVLDEGLGGLSDDELVGMLRASRRLAAWQDGAELAAVAELDARRLRGSGRPGWSRVSEQVSAELAAALVLTGRSADGLLGLARDLARLPMIRRALLAGRVDRARAVVFAAELSGLGDVAAAAVASAFAGLAGSMTTGQLRAALRAMVLYLDPAAVRRRADKARGQARVEAWAEGSGNAALAGRELAPADAIAADRRITAIARALQQAGAPGSLDQLRAAVFTALLAGRDPDTLLPAPDRPVPRRGDPGRPGPSGCRLGPSTADSSPGMAGPGPARSGPGLGRGPAGGGPGGLGALTGSVHLVMPASAWLGLSDAPGEAAGAGPLDARTCRDLASRLAAGPGTRWCVTLTGGDGRAVAHACARDGPPGARAGPGPPGDWAAWLARLRPDWLERGACSHVREVRGYQPGSRLRNLICARQRTCSFPGCRRPAARCDLDHTIPYDQGGRSCECNLAALCRRHHQIKQAPGWTLTQPEPGLLTWTAPHGRSYTVTSDPYPV